MNRLLVAVMVLGMGVAGCATSVDEPTEPTPADVPEKDPPAQIHGATVTNPYDVVMTPPGQGDELEGVGPRQKPPIPDFKPVQIGEK